MDKETSKNRDLIHKNEKNIMEKLQNFNPKTKIKFYYTSIWDESLYTPWRQIMSDTILKNIKIQNGLQSLLKACDADDIFLIEKNTFLCIKLLHIKTSAKITGITITTIFCFSSINLKNSFQIYLENLL